MTVPYAAPAGTTRLSAQAAAVMRATIRLAGGREVCFAGTVDDNGVVVQARTVARGDSSSVLALPGFAEPGEILLHNHPSGLLEPSNADMEVAARIHENGVGFGIVDNDVTDLYVVVEVPASARRTPIEPEEISHDLGPDGPISAHLTRYEDRPAQREMAAAVAGLYNEGGVGLLEAGTGVGKSMGYLVPALRWAARNGERTVVSTNTINLQEQLVGKDLPFLARALDDQKVRFALLKGWRNYLCHLRLDQARSSGSALLEPGMVDEVARLAEWAERTSDGSLADLTVPPRPEAWDEVSAEPDLCPRLKCPHYDKCFFFRARREAAQADVIVVNHHLLMSDVAVRRAAQNWTDAAVLPAYKRLVVDEGHHLEDAAGAHLGVSVSRRSLQRLFARLERRGKGILPALAERLRSRNDLLSTASMDLLETRLAPSVQAGRDSASLLFDLLDTFLKDSGTPIVRLGADFEQHRLWKAGLGSALDDLLGQIGMLQQGLRMVRERLETDTRRAEELAPTLNELRAVARRLEIAGDGLRMTLRVPADAPESVRWVEVRGRDRNIAVVSVPLDLSPILREDLFERAGTAVVTSATLADNGNFAFLEQRLGLDATDARPVSHTFPSPFDYPRQALLGVPNDLPAPNEDPVGHARALVRIVTDLADASDGGMFVLFTSHRDVRVAAEELRNRGFERRWPLQVHGEESRDTLIRRFRDSGRGVLLGTASFWEGVDVPGDALRALVIARLPFRVPTDPITAAQCEAIEVRGGDSFREYMLPHAALRLKQGFGRLIRSSHDRGVVVIADPRVLRKNYGRRLLAGLPPARRVVGTWEVVRGAAIVVLGEGSG